MKMRSLKHKKIFFSLILFAVLAALIPASSVQAVASLQCNTTQYEACKTITCTFNSDITPNTGKNYGVFWFYDVPQAAIDNNWELSRAATGGAQEFVLGGQTRVSELQRISGQDLLAAQRAVTKEIEATKFKVPAAGTPNNLEVIRQ